MSDEKEQHRREADNEAFKYRIIEQQAEIKGLVQKANDGIKTLDEKIEDHKMRIVNIESAIWGYPKGDDIGLLEKHRKLARNWAIIISICAFIFSAVGRIISPLYDKWVADWAYNSPSENWMRETARPKVRVYKIYRKKESPEESSEQQSSPKP